MSPGEFQLGRGVVPINIGSNCSFALREGTECIVVTFVHKADTESVSKLDAGEGSKDSRMIP